MRQVAGKRYTVGPASLLGAAAGGSDDWAKSRGVKYSYTIELRDTGYYGFDLPAKYIVDTAKEAQAATFVFASHVAESNDMRNAAQVDSWFAKYKKTIFGWK